MYCVFCTIAELHQLSLMFLCLPSPLQPCLPPPPILPIYAHQRQAARHSTDHETQGPGLSSIPSLRQTLLTRSTNVDVIVIRFSSTFRALKVIQARQISGFNELKRE